MLGEFPWQVRVGEAADGTDYVSPPRVISSETTGKKLPGRWASTSRGRISGRLRLARQSARSGRRLREPAVSSERGDEEHLGGVCGFLLLLVVMMIGFDMIARNEQVFTGSYQVSTPIRAARRRSSPTSSTFKGHTSNVELTTSTDVNNHWIYLNYALINEDTGQAFDFGREVSYYHGYDSDGSWTEGGQNDHVAMPSVPPGSYYLRVEPEGDPRLWSHLLHDHRQAGCSPIQLLWSRATGLAGAGGAAHVAIPEFRTFALGRERSSRRSNSGDNAE